MISQPPLLIELKASREPSGEMRGDKRNASQVRDLLLVGAIVVHHPDFLVAGALADKVNLGFGDPGYASAQAEDDFVGEPVRDHAHRIGGGIIGVLLAEHLRRRLILDVVEPSLHRDFAGGCAQVAECEHGGVRRRGIPC